MENNDLHWLAGLLEGEGSFVAPPPSSPRKPRVVLVTTDQDVAERAHSLMGGGIGSRIRPPHKEIFAVTVSGRPALALMKLLAPLMGHRRRERIEHVLQVTPPIGIWYGRDIKLDPARRAAIAARYAEGGVSQTVVAAEFGISQPLVSQIVRGRWRQAA